MFGLLGPNGAGKTQTISMLTGVIHAHAPAPGRHRRVRYPHPAGQVKQINGLVPQDLALYPTLSAGTNSQLLSAASTG